MDIFSIESLMVGNYLLSEQVSIRELVQNGSRNVIVVDGDVFVASYLFRNFQWVLGGTSEFAENIRIFVKAFQDLNIKLTFFFQVHDLKEQTSRHWRKYSKVSMQCVKRILRLAELRQSVQSISTILHNIKPHDMNCWAISVLREMNCEIICTLKDHEWHIASYARANDCFAILSQSVCFLLFENLNSLFMTLKNFDLRDMKTDLYSSNALANQLGLNRKFFPLLVTFLGTTQTSNCAFMKQVRKIIRSRLSMRSPLFCSMVAAYIREYCEHLSLENVPTSFLTDHFPKHAEMLIKIYSKYEVMLKDQIEYSENLLSDESILNKWEKIKMKCEELTKEGKLCGRIQSIIVKQEYEQFVTLEDFVDFPSASFLYRRLRKGVYAILLHEAVNFVENCDVKELCIDRENYPDRRVSVSPSPIDSSLHPGLLAFWDPSIKNHGLSDKKWQLFVAVVSPSLNHHLLRDLRESLVIPVVLLHYLIHELPVFSHNMSLKRLQPWELDVFLAVAITLPNTDKDFLRSIHVQYVNVRVVRLIGLFIQGCEIMEMVVQSCGLMLEEHRSSICNYFDGHLFNHLYGKAETGREIIEPNTEMFREYLRIRLKFFGSLPITMYPTT